MACAWAAEETLDFGGNLDHVTSAFRLRLGGTPHGRTRFTVFV